MTSGSHIRRIILSGFLLCIVISLCDGGNLLVRQNDITVKVGRTVYLNPDDLVFKKLRKGDEACRVEVVQNDPITQRVGQIEPKAFGCTYQPYTVKYIHSGNPFLNEDKVKMRVHRFTARKTTTQTVYLNVKIVNASSELVVTRGLRPVVVPEFNGISNAIDSSAIRFNHSRSSKVSCIVSFNKWGSEWPLVGHIVTGKQNRPVEGLKKNCQEFLYMNLHYEHLQKPTPDVDYLPLSIELFDPEVSDDIITERYFLPIYIKGALLNSPPRSSFMSMYMMDVDQFVLSTIIPGIISAEDYESPNSHLVYNISKPPGPGQGFFVSLDDHATEITSFLQDDLENRRIGYQPPNKSFPERKIYEVEFKVFDSHFAESMPIVLHIAVRPSSTNAPRISYNKGLVLLEGQSRIIDGNSIGIVDKDNLDDLRIYVTSGPQHGELLLDNNPLIFFTVNDLNEEKVKYIHDDSESTRDRLDFRIYDGSNTMSVSYFIQIIPKDDSAPYVINNLGMELNEGGTKRFTKDMLLAHDTDSVDLNIIYMIVHPTENGEIVRKQKPSDTGARVNKFKQRDLIKGQIYYRHFGREKFEDHFRFTISDEQDPPNVSEIETFYIIINPVNENPPKLSPDATRLMHVLETDIALITRSELQYTDAETEDDKLTYVITTPPYFVYAIGDRETEDAGRIIATHNLTMVVKSDDIPAARTFKQEDINHMKIGYMPPLKDIGPEARLVRFVYTVQDSSGNKVLNQQFDIDVQPVNDKYPEFIVTSNLLVEEGGILGISNTHISAVDEDTNESDLVFVLEEGPTHGIFQHSGVNLREKGTFNFLDLRKKNLRYINDGSEVYMDTFTVTVFDGVNRVSKVFTIEIIPIDDEAPRVQGNLRSNMIVSEGDEAVITSNVLAATDEDTDDGTLVFLIVKQPKYGILQLNGNPTTKFTQKDVSDNIVKYIHTSGEIGPKSIKDSVTFIVSDQNFIATAELPMYILNITITAVDNQQPTIISGDVIEVEEGQRFVFTPDFITAKDPDTEPEMIKFVITKQPRWGYLENVKPSPGSEKSNIGNPVTTFRLQDIIDRSINYIQATHKGVEPTEDSFSFYATDGNLTSPDKTAIITIKPVNDEEPDVMLNDIFVEEGGSMIIDQSTVDAVDMDIPKEHISLSISQPPEHGDIVLMLHTKNGDVEASVNDFSAEELHNGLKLKYRHDNSEHFSDRFALTVSDGKHEVKKVCNVTIRSLNDALPQIIKNTGLILEYGDHAVISGLVLQAIDEDNEFDEIYYIVVSVPRKGVLQYCSDPHSPTFSLECEEIIAGRNFSQKDIDNNHVRYLHTRSTGGSEIDNFSFVLTDGTNKRHVENFEIRIMNAKRSNIALLNKGISIREGERVALTTSNLSASDESTKPEDIVFAIIRPPRLGQMEHIDRPLISVSSFTQLDIASQKIVYNHLTKTDFLEDTFTFTVTNGYSDAKDAEFHIKIDPLDKILPTLEVNNLVEVLQGSEVAITSNHLRADDPDTASSNVTYMIAKQPTYGRLYNRGVYITSLFTQSSIDRGFVTYESEGSHTGLDNFLFTVTDGRHDGFLINGTLQLQPVMCSIFIKPLVNDAPRLLTLKHPESLDVFPDGRYGFELNSRVLKAVDSDTTNTHLVYVIEQRPKHGHIENMEAKRFVRRRFTQRDLDENSLRFVIDEKDRETNDSFSFRIEDNRGNSLDGQRLELRWSVIEFERASLVVCENIGTLPLTLTRTGDLETLAFVAIEARDRTTRTNEDYIPSAAQQVQFDPGMSESTWDLRILDDGLLENTESIAIYIQQPVNAVLGRRRKMRIRLINAEDGECPQYLGMISKHQREIPDSLYLPGNAIETESETVVLGSNFNRKDKQKNPFENTYNTDPSDSSQEDSKTVGITDLSLDGKTRNTDTVQSQSTKNSSSGKKKKKKRRKRKGRKRPKSSRNTDMVETPVEGGLENVDTTISRPVLQNVDIKAPQGCATLTKNLLYFDPDTQQMYKCNGLSWQAWRPDSNQDEQPETKECQQGWSKFDERCYKFINERLTWEVAETLCQMSHEAHLSTVRSKKHLTWLSQLSGKKAFWIGLNDKEETGVWKYSNGEAISYTKWDKGGPRVKRMLHRKNCVLVDKKGKWKNKICNKRKSRLICEQDIGVGDASRSPPKRDISNSRSKSKSSRRRKCRKKECRTESRSQPKRHISNSRSKSSTRTGFFFGN